MSAYLDILKKRRSIRKVSEDSPVEDQQLLGMLKEVVDCLPTAYNMQNTRAVLLLADDHKTLWNEIVLETLRLMVPPDKFGRTETKIAGFAGGHGTILFFNDEAVAEEQRVRLPQYAADVGNWQLQHNGMLQISVWTMLVEQGLAASLQHYNPLIDEAVKARWKLPQSWTLISQMPFGTADETPAAKTTIPVDQRVLCFGG